MPFCRRCGDIVSGEKCRKCGGSAVAAAVRWNPGSSTSSVSDAREKWTKLSQPKEETNPPPIRRAKSTVITPAFLQQTKSAEIKPSAEVDRPEGNAKVAALPPPRTPSPFKSLSAANPVNPDSPDPSIVLNLNKTGGSLAKVYGSVLQPTETLASFVCSACDAPFPPDATIYPSLTSNKQFFCRPCFGEHGGSRGPCAACGKDVLRLKAEGGFIENFGRVWHSKCFKCEGCGRDIGSRPMVDVLGRPSCDDCFDDCLNRGRVSARASRNPSPASKAVGMIASPTRAKPPGSRPESSLSSQSNPGGLRKSSSQGGLSDPNAVVEELARRIGASPIRKEPSSETPSPPKRTRALSDAQRATPAVRSITDRLAAMQSSPAPSSPSGTTQAMRFPAADFGTPIGTPYSEPSTVTTPPASVKAIDPDSSITPSRSNKLEGPKPSSGLLTPGSTPTQSPMGTPPVHLINIASPPGPSSKIPSLRGRHSVSSISSPSTTSPSGSTPRRPSASIREQSRIPSGSSPKTSSYSSPKLGPFKSNLPTISSSPLSSKASSPASTLALKPKASRPSLALAVAPPSAEAKCVRCHEKLHDVKSDGRIVSVPSPTDAADLEHYHAGCFRCDACAGAFAEIDGAASFVRFEGGVRHLECTPTKRVPIFRHPSHDSLPPARDFKVTEVKDNGALNKGRKLGARPVSMYGSPSSIPKPSSHQSHGSMATMTPNLTGSRTMPPAPRFGSTTACPGCRITVSPMERGIVPGPGATKWHATCLVCGGKNSSKRTSGTWINREDAKGPGCSKKLDSAAKGDISEGVLWCRDCWESVKSTIMPESPTSALSPDVATGTSSPFPSSSSMSRPHSSLGLNSSTALARQMSRSGAASPVRRPFIFPPQASAPISEDDVMGDVAEAGSATQYFGGRITPHFTGMRPASPVRPQYTGAGIRSISPVRRQLTGAVEGVEPEPLTIQYTGGGVPVTRQLTTSRRPKSALGTRSFSSQKSMDGGRGMFLVRQMTGQTVTKDE